MNGSAQIFLYAYFSFRLSSRLIIDRRLTKIGTYDRNHVAVNHRVKKSLLSIQDGRQKSKMTATKLSFLTFPHQTAGFPAHHLDI